MRASGARAACSRSRCGRVCLEGVAAGAGSRLGAGRWFWWTSGRVSTGDFAVWGQAAFRSVFGSLPTAAGGRCLFLCGFTILNSAGARGVLF